MTLTSNSKAITCLVPALFTPAGGTAPYTFAVLAGGINGSINSSGIYTAPAQFGIDTIQCTDSLGAVATAKISVMSHLKLLCDILANEMQLASDQVFIWNQKLPVLKDERLYVAVGVLTSKPFSNSGRLNDDGTITQFTNLRTMVSIDIMSRGMIAVDRKEEIVMALASVYAEQQQGLNSFSIGKLPSNIVAVNAEEGAAIPYRFNLTVSMQHAVTKTKAVDYYDTFVDNQIVTES